MNKLFCTLMVTIYLLCACAPTPAVNTAVPPTPELIAMLETPSRLPDGESVKLKFTLTNNADVEWYVLKWYTPLEGIFGEIFRVTRDGQPVPYQGPLVMRGDPMPDNYVLLQPGESVTAVVDLATVYDFAQPGKYTIKFLSPRISAVVRTEAELTKTVDDLGPIEIASNQVSVEIAGASEPLTRRTPAEAAEMIGDYLRQQKPDLPPELLLSPEELIMPEAWEQLRVQLFRITDGIFANESFLIHGECVLPLGTTVGGRGLTSLEMSDLDRDGRPELLFTYSFGSGIHQSRIGMYAPAYDNCRIYESETAYLGDLGLFQEGVNDVDVRAVESDETTLRLRYLDTLGRLTIEQPAGQVKLVLQVDESLPDDVGQKIIHINE